MPQEVLQLMASYVSNGRGVTLGICGFILDSGHYAQYRIGGELLIDAVDDDSTYPMKMNILFWQDDDDNDMSMLHKTYDFQTNTL